MIPVLILLGIFLFMFPLLLSVYEHKESIRLGKIFDYLERIEKDRYLNYHVFYKSSDDIIRINGKEYRKEDIMIIGKLKTGETEIVFYPDGENKIITTDYEQDF